MPVVPESPTLARLYPERDRAIRVAVVLALTGAVLFVLGLILGFAFVGRHGGGLVQGWDDQVEAWSVTHRGGLVGASKVVAFLGDAPKLAVIAAILTVLLLLILRSVRALVPLAAYLGGEAEVYLIRQVIHRHRPPTANFPAPGAVPGVHETSYSFPSGHAVAVTAVLFALAGAVFWARRWWWPWLLALAASLFVIDTRLVLGVHWWSDVVFGLVIGIGWGVAVAWAARQLEWAHLRALLPGSKPDRSR